MNKKQKARSGQESQPSPSSSSSPSKTGRSKQKTGGSNPEASVPFPLGEVRVLEHPDEDNLVLEMQGVPDAMVNSLRHSVMKCVRTLAFQWVFRIENTGAMIDEQLSSRVGEVDVRMDPRLMKTLPDSFNLHYLEEHTQLRGVPKLYSNLDEPESEACEFEDYILVYDLNVECGMDGDVREVTAADLVWKPFGRQREKFSAHLSLLNASKHPITRLFHGQRLSLQAWAIVGASEHVKFSAVSNCHFQLKHSVQILDPAALDIENLGNLLINVCPQRVFARSELKAPQEEEEEEQQQPDAMGPVKVRNEMACDLCNECVLQPKLKPHLRVQPRPDHYWFFIEGKGRVPAEKVLLYAVDWLIERTQTLSLEE